MKFLQLNINYIITSCDDLWYHQMENRYDGIFLHKTNHNNSTTLGNFKNCKVKVHTILKNQTSGYLVGAKTTKNIFLGKI